MSRTTPVDAIMDAPENTVTSLPCGMASIERSSLRGGVRPSPAPDPLQSAGTVDVTPERASTCHQSSDKSFKDDSSYQGHCGGS